MKTKYFTDGTIFERTQGVQLVPATLGHRVTNLAYVKGFGGARAKLLTDLSAYMPPAAADPINYPCVRYYVDPVSGVDANAGTSWATALKRVSVALAKSDVDVVLCKGGLIYKSDATGPQGLSDYAGTRSVCVVAVGPPALFTTAYELTWTAHATEANVFQSSGTAGTMIRVVDARQRNANGDYVALTNVASIALVGTTPGSWFYASSVLYVRLSDDATPDINTLGLRVIFQRVTADSVKVHFKNIHFIGGSGAALVLQTGTITTYVTAEDCCFSHSYNGNGVSVLDVGLAIFIRCRASANFNDGFNYHAANSIDPHFIEIDCVGIGNLSVGDGNGTSAHESTRGFRLGCDYARNGGPGIADINTSKSFNVAITSRENTGTSTTRGIALGDTCEMWVDGAFCEGNQGNDVESTGTSVLHFRDLSISTNYGKPTKLNSSTHDQTFT